MPAELIDAPRPRVSATQPGRPQIALLGALGVYAAAFAVREAVLPPHSTILCNVLALPLGAGAVGFARTVLRREGLGGRLRSAWLWLCASLAAFWLGDVSFVLLKILQGGGVMGASLADAAYLASYVLGFVGLVALRGRRPDGEGRSAFLLDTAIVAIGGSMIAWRVFVTPVLFDSERAVEGVVALGYVVGDLALLLGLAIVGLRPLRGGVLVSLALLWLGLALRLCADVSFWRHVLRAEEGSGFASAMYALSWFTLAAAGFAQARAVTSAAPLPQRRAGFSPLPYLAAAAGYAVLLHVVHRRADVDVVFLMLAGVALTCTVLARQLVSERSHLKLAAERLTQASEARFRSLVQNASDIVLLIGAGGEIRYHTPSAERFVGLAGARLESSTLQEFVHPEDRARVDGLLAEAIARPGTTPSAEWRLRWADGGWHFVEVRAKSVPADPNLDGVILTLRSVHERKVLEERLAHQAFHDPLTQLANRSLFVDRLEHALVRARRSGRSLSVLFIDLDDFKAVNDGFGHATGDLLLVEVARRVLACVRASDTAARLGGDEFAVLVEEGGVGTAAEIAARVAQAIAEPFDVAAPQVFLTASIGIAGESGAETAGDLLRNADVAMYRAKRSGKGQLVVFEASMQAAVRARLELEGELRGAAERGELTLVYQPVVELASGRIVGAEALLRWVHPRRGRLRPAEFLPAAESAGIGAALGTWVVVEACRCAGRWPAIDGPEQLPFVCVNASPALLSSRSFLESVEGILKDARIPPARLVVELTERAAVEDASPALDGMRQLRSLGVRMAIDDFGAGYSSLGRLRELPVDILKLDRQFVEGVAGDDGLEQLTRGILDLARALGKVVIAEGIERREQAERLGAHGCTLGQGFLFSLPLSAEELAAKLSAASLQRA